MAFCIANVCIWKRKLFPWFDFYLHSKLFARSEKGNWIWGEQATFSANISSIFSILLVSYLPYSTKLLRRHNGKVQASHDSYFIFKIYFCARRIHPWLAQSWQPWIKYKKKKKSLQLFALLFNEMSPKVHCCLIQGWPLLYS